ncbi:MAG: hypothetical protein DMD96_26235 [Candidatus Rokuibacteriota bacterium]|nr:MAG: hypothetical protein DMD96_26235 [Candidatus Rokubacteria bacterium]
MASRESIRWAGLAGALALLAALVAAVVLIEVLVAPSLRQPATRVVGAVVLLLAVFRIRAVVRASIERPTAWGVDDAGHPRAPDPRLSRFHDEITFSTRSHSYFEHMLWPRLVALARGGTGPSGGLEKPPGRRLGRGPSLEALARLVASLERHQ